MNERPTNEEGASAEITDAYGTRYVRDAGTGQMHRVGPKQPKRAPSKMFDIEAALAAIKEEPKALEIINETDNNISPQ